MKRITFFLLIIFSLVYSQLPQSSGNLLHINVNQDTVCYSDTLAFWEYGINDYYSKYRNIIRIQDSLYFIRENSYSPEYFIGNYLVELENSFSGNRRDFIYYSAFDVIGLYNIPSNIFEVSDGFWIFDDVFGNGFLSKSDSFYVNDVGGSDYLYHISGKVDSLHFVIWNNNYEIKFYLIDLSESPLFDTTSAINLNFDYLDNPVQIEHFKEDLYFIQTSNNLKLYKFQSDSFQYIKTVLSNVDYSDICYKKNQLYVYEYHKLIKHTLNMDDTTFFQGQVLLEGDIYVERDYEFSVKVDSNEIVLFDVMNETVAKTWDISKLNHCFLPLLDYPDIYIHNTKNVTAINFQYVLPEKHLLVNAYPNPFNSSIVFKVDGNLNNKIELKIFDIRGRLVKQFTNNNRKNIRKIIWNPVHLSSGLYFVQISNGLEIRQMKVCYIK